MSIYSIDIQGGYSGTVEVSYGDIKIEFPTATLHNKLQRFNFHLLTPHRKNLEFNLLRFMNGEWCDDRNLQLLVPGPQLKPELQNAAKKAITKMGI